MLPEGGRESCRHWHISQPPALGHRDVQSLFDYLEGGDTLDEFLKQFPSVRRERAIAALELARESVLTSARPA